MDVGVGILHTNDCRSSLALSFIPRLSTGRRGLIFQELHLRALRHYVPQARSIYVGTR